MAEGHDPPVARLLAQLLTSGLFGALLPRRAGQRAAAGGVSPRSGILSRGFRVAEAPRPLPPMV